MLICKMKTIFGFIWRSSSHFFLLLENLQEVQPSHLLSRNGVQSDFGEVHPIVFLLLENLQEVQPSHVGDQKRS